MIAMTRLFIPDWKNLFLGLKMIRQLLKDHGLATLSFLIIILVALLFPYPWNLIPLDIYNLLLR